MEQAAIFGPALALAGWTMAVLLIMPYRRFKALFAGQVKADDFKLGESADVPPSVSIPNRNFMNLLEAPLIFYVTCIILFLLQAVNPLSVVAAWVYFGLRVVHSLIHLTYNKVEHRVIPFALSNVAIVVVWVVAVCSLVGS